jgi:FkbM family methyltransferase
VIYRRALRRVLPRPIALALRREWLAWRITSDKAFKEGEVDLLQQFVRPSDICWDIGANSGMYTLPLSRLAAHVIAFEPVPHSREILERVKRRAGLDNVTIRDLALADREGHARMTVPTEGFYGGYYLAALADDGGEPVEVATIDGLIANGLPEPDFIKCDVEGAEARVISGARRLLSRRRPIWLLETFEDDVLPVMQRYGYGAYVYRGPGRLERVQVRTPKSRNYLLLPEASA